MPVPTAPIADVAGHYAGAITRLAAFVIDITLAGSAFTIASGAVGSTLQAIGQLRDWRHRRTSRR